MLNTFNKALKIPELRKKLVFTFLMLIVFRIGSSIPVPGIDVNVVKEAINQHGGAFALYDVIAGGALSQFTLFALSVTPYITSSIIIQLLAVAIPSMEEMQKSGEQGRKKLASWTRYLTVILALIQATALSVGMFRNALMSDSIISTIAVVLTLTAGTSFLMWLGEMITEKGVGNGMSMIIFFGIVSRFPRDVKHTIELAKAGQINFIQIALFILVSLLIVVGVILVLQGVRKIPVQYAKRTVGRSTYGGKQSHIPLKVNQAGVIPVIFASSLLAFPQVLQLFIKNQSYAQFVAKWFNGTAAPGIYIFSLLQFILVIGFSYFYISITFNPVEVADNMKNSNGFIPGIRPGKPTSDFISKTLNRLTFVGAIFLAIIASVPTIIYQATNVPFKFGGTSLLIVVGVAIETAKQLESQTVMRNYQGFLK